MQNKNFIYNILKSKLNGRIHSNKTLSQFFTLKMHCVADYFFEPTSVDDWKGIMELINMNNIPYLIIGGGSNVAILKSRISGIVLRNKYIKKTVEYEEKNFIDLRISSGYPMSHLIKETIEMGLSGFEYHYGLPGTLGGAIYMNSKWSDPLCYVSDTLLLASIMDRDSSIRKESREYFNFDYDYSKIQDTGELFIDGLFRLTKHDSSELKKRAESALDYRKKTQPIGVATGGCFFQNISSNEKNSYNLPTTSAGYLIDKSGLKGLKIGGFEVSKKHANFIVNLGNGTADDLKKIIKTVKDKVRKNFNIILKEEVRVL